MYPYGHILVHMMNPMLSKVLNKQDVSGWLMSEKLDGVRAIWDGSVLRTRHGNKIDAPDWWIDRLPAGTALDGELWAGRGNFGKVLSWYRRKSPVNSEWARLEFVAFDIPQSDMTSIERIELLKSIAVKQVEHVICQDREHAFSVMQEIVKANGEGIMLRDPSASYEFKRSSKLLKLKPGEGA